jgi:hypothetical protein
MGSNTKKSLQDAYVTEFISSDDCSTCFGYHYHTSSGGLRCAHIYMWPLLSSRSAGSLRLNTMYLIFALQFSLFRYFYTLGFKLPPVSSNCLKIKMAMATRCLEGLFTSCNHNNLKLGLAQRSFTPSYFLFPSSYHNLKLGLAQRSLTPPHLLFTSSYHNTLTLGLQLAL